MDGSCCVESCVPSRGIRPPSTPVMAAEQLAGAAGAQRLCGVGSMVPSRRLEPRILPPAVTACRASWAPAEPSPGWGTLPSGTDSSPEDTCGQGRCSGRIRTPFPKFRAFCLISLGD